jgi:hypothetical protein
MKPQGITDLLKANTYPGRGIILGRSEDGRRAVLIYFIMGRSENSRNRVFTRTEDGIRTEAYDPAKLTDPSLVIYHPIRKVDGHIIVTNGDQTDTIRDSMFAENSFHSALQKREFEPDAPNYTPRISGLLNADGSYKLSILKTLDGDPACCCRQFFEYETPRPGIGHFLHTYKSDGDPLPSFEGEPVAIAVSGTIRELAEAVWNTLNADNKVSLYAYEKNLATGETDSFIYNKNS